MITNWAVKIKADSSEDAKNKIWEEYKENFTQKGLSIDDLKIVMDGDYFIVCAQYKNDQL